MFKFLTKFIDTNQGFLNRYTKIVKQINQLEDSISQLSDQELKAKTPQLKQQLEQGKTLDDLLPEAFAVVREASKRVNKQRHFDVQMMAGIAFHEGKVAEQKTGEGKTLSATTAVYLNALAGKGVHVVTVNDYLAQRDGGWMGSVYNFLGLTTSILVHEKSLLYDTEYFNDQVQDWRLQHLKEVERKNAYQSDITYGTNNEFGFDYLRDNMVRDPQEQTQRGHYFAIVDEVDSILIDEARTPLIISQPDTDPTDKYVKFAKLISTLSPSDYSIDEKHRTAHLNESGILKLEKRLNVNNLYEKDFETIHHVENALRARSLYEKDKQYIVQNNEVVIVDEFTGRLMYGRRYSEGLHQAIEAKENVPIQQESRTLATISIQNYFRMYKKLAGMTGTAATEAEEFSKIYKMDVIIIPTNRVMARKDLADQIYKNERVKMEAIGREIEKIHSTGQPILVGTRDIEHNELISRLLKHKNIKHEVLNAKNHLREALILAKAGEKGAVTIATNMAGRGVDIALGGDEPKKSLDISDEEFNKLHSNWEQKTSQIKDLGGLFVLGSERHESRRIDNQLRGRAGRQGDNGATRFFVSLDDEIVRIFGGDRIAKVMEALKMPENMPIEHPLVSKSIENAQTKVEGFYFDQRKNVVEYDDVMNKQREIIYGLRNKILISLQQKENVVNDEEQFDAKTLKSTILEKMYDQVDFMVHQTKEGSYSDDDYERITNEVSEIIPFDEDSRKDLYQNITHKKTAKELAEFLYGVIDNIYQARETQFGDQTIAYMERAIYLQTLDELWMDHLDQMTALRDGIGLRAYGQRDPLVEYKAESFNYFQRLLKNIDNDLTQKIFRVLPQSADQILMSNAFQNIYELGPNLNASSSTELNNANVQNTNPATKQLFEQEMQKIQQPIKNTSNIGRNDPCWCGSGKKWKKCHYPQI